VLVCETSLQTMMWMFKYWLCVPWWHSCYAGK